MENFIPETWKILSRKPGKYYPGNLEGNECKQRLDKQKTSPDSILT